MKYLQLILLSLCLFLASSIATPSEGYGQRIRGFKPKKKTSSSYSPPKVPTGKVIKPNNVPKVPKSTPTSKDKIRDTNLGQKNANNVGPTTVVTKKPLPLKKDELDFSRVKNGKTAAEHINLHSKDDLSRPYHGVFNNDPVDVTSKAWASKGKIGFDKEPTGDIYYIPYKNAGWEGGFKGSGNKLHYVKVVT